MFMLINELYTVIRDYCEVLRSSVRRARRAACALFLTLAPLRQTLSFFARGRLESCRLMWPWGAFNAGKRASDNRADA